MHTVIVQIMGAWAKGASLLLIVYTLVDIRKGLEDIMAGPINTF